MAAFRLILCTVIATICFCSLINAAVVHNFIYAEELANPNEIGDRAEDYLTFPSYDSVRPRRSIKSEGHSGEKICYSATPCGWAVYTPFERRVDYFMRNVCSCPSSHKCIKMEDDLSVSAWIYRCKTNTTATDIESPNESNSN